MNYFTISIAFYAGASIITLVMMLGSYCENVCCKRNYSHSIKVLLLIFACSCLWPILLVYTTIYLCDLRSKTKSCEDDRSERISHIVFDKPVDSGQWITGITIRKPAISPDPDTEARLKFDIDIELDSPLSGIGAQSSASTKVYMNDSGELEFVDGDLVKAGNLDIAIDTIEKIIGWHFDGILK